MSQRLCWERIGKKGFQPVVWNIDGLSMYIGKDLRPRKHNVHAAGWFKSDITFILGLWLPFAKEKIHISRVVSFQRF